MESNIRRGKSFFSRYILGVGIALCCFVLSDGL